jgi:hypothetical protein
MPLDAIAGTRLPLTMARAEDLINAAALRDGNLAQITQAARELMQAVRSARGLSLETTASLH